MLELRSRGYRFLPQFLQRKRRDLDRWMLSTTEQIDGINSFLLPLRLIHSRMLTRSEVDDILLSAPHRSSSDLSEDYIF